MNGEVNFLKDKGRFVKDGLIILDKPEGFTSQDAVSKARKATGIKKIGHTGTLDKFATGVLPLMIGSCTRLSRFVMEGRKRYAALFRFGIETDTLDPEGAETKRAEIPTRDAIVTILPSFRGRILQAPPVYSAIHINGKRAHELARSGENPEMAVRPIDIYSLELTEYSSEGLGRFEIECSKGCYVRSLARDIGSACGSAAYVAELRREITGGFSLDDAVALESIGPGSVMAFSPEIAKKAGMGSALLKDSRIGDFMNGKKLSIDFFDAIMNSESDIYAIYSSDGILKGVVSAIALHPRYEMVTGRNP